MLFMSHASFHLIFTKLNKVPAIIIIPSKSRLRDESFAQGHRVGKKKSEPMKPNSRTYTLNCYLPRSYRCVFVGIRLHDVCKMARRVCGTWPAHDTKQKTEQWRVWTSGTERRDQIPPPSLASRESRGKSLNPFVPQNASMQVVIWKQILPISCGC